MSSNGQELSLLQLTRAEDRVSGYESQDDSQYRSDPRSKKADIRRSISRVSFVP